MKTLQTFFTKEKIKLLLQIPITLLIIAFVPWSLAKLGCFILLWVLTFRAPTKVEWIALFLLALFFLGTDYTTIRNGQWAFRDADIFSVIPYWQFFMWPFFIYHVSKVLG
jgi:hypothetical protein